ncbi:hypothetical protein B0H63DRAFT_476459 [Podospora didyma]|uniref:Uncharacterized protein n=1 Tax=Podospora didyma TaxID=330526 RepID=A0AAE0NHM5_9PEZI|nr:hypothetical protein B0H63DRAFT_476459 [Podospora didyma]
MQTIYAFVTLYRTLTRCFFPSLCLIMPSRVGSARHRFRLEISLANIMVQRRRPNPSMGITRPTTAFQGAPSH